MNSKVYILRDLNTQTNINRHMCTHIQIFTCNEISIDTERNTTQRSQSKQKTKEQVLLVRNSKCLLSGRK